MCGIYGQLQLNGTAPTSVPLEAATQALVHRGPDELGIWRGQQVVLGMRRLSIIDLSGGQQPIWNEHDSCCIVFNGELYNFQDLRPELEARGHRFRTRSDTEVVLHAYEEWGVNCVRRFNGMFALAIWDATRQLLFVARDRIGEKPLYYYPDGERLIFASEIKAILTDPSVPRRLSHQGLVNFLTFGRAVAPTTIYERIAKLLPGHYLVAHQGQVQIVKYWDVGEEPQLQPGDEFSEDQYAARILELLDDSVRRRMIADVPVGAFLSGGVDSSAIVALMRRYTREPVKTFSLGFSIGGAYNELLEAQHVARSLGTEHHELRVEHVDLVAVLRTLIYHYDEPFGDAAGFPVYLLSRFAREHVKVVLTGDGGDELFGGYRRYAADQLAGAYQLLPRLLTHTLVPSLVEQLPRFRRIKRTIQTLPIGEPGRRYAAWLEIFTADMRAELLRSDIAAQVAGYDPAWQYPRNYWRLNGTSASDHLNRLMYIDLKTLLADSYLEKVDKATMACGIEARLPLLDHRLVELAFQIPSRFKIQGWDLKQILKKAVRGLVPEQVLARPKHGFTVPMDPWFRGALMHYTREILLDERTRRRGLFDGTVVERLLRDHASGRHVHDEHIWLLLNFELWQRIYIDGESV
jgi:asparagine synthase (glutamine-hydrolysing)